MQTIPTWLQAAFADWVTKRIYVDRCGNYRQSDTLSDPIVVYNDRLKAVYPHHQEFQRAALLWLALWEEVPTAKLGLSDCLRRATAESRR